MTDRLPAHLEVSALLRRVEASGDFGSVIRRGDRDRGALLLLISCRGNHHSALERVLDIGGNYQWREMGPSESADSAKVAAFLAQRARFDDDSWLIELDIAHPERFIAETIASA